MTLKWYWGPPKQFWRLMRKKKEISNCLFKLLSSCQYVTNSRDLPQTVLAGAPNIFYSIYVVGRERVLHRVRCFDKISCFVSADRGSGFRVNLHVVSGEGYWLYCPYGDDSISRNFQMGVCNIVYSFQSNAPLARWRCHAQIGKSASVIFFVGMKQILRNDPSQLVSS